MDSGQQSHNGNQPGRASESLNPKCPVCGLDLMEFRTSGRLGCPIDYDIFANTLEAFFESNQLASLHVGKWPRRGPNRFEALKDRAELRLAIESQNYELAALLRDRIRDRTKQRKAHP